MRLPAAVERLLTEMSARYGVDAGGMAAGVRSRLESRTELGPLVPLPIDADLSDRVTVLGVGRCRTAAWSAPRARKVVLSEVQLFPAVEGFALTILPRHGLAAPVLAADFMLLPSALRVNLDVYGAPSVTRGVLAPLAASFAGLGNRGVSHWAAPLASAEGLHARLSPRLVGEAYGALAAGLGAYLDTLAHAPELDGRSDEQAAFFRLVHEHGPRLRMRALFGRAWAERYGRLLFE